MRKKTCSYCGKEFDIRDFYKSRNSDDFVCKNCHKKMIEEGKRIDEDFEVYDDNTNQPDRDSYYEGDDWNKRDHQQPDYGDSH